MNVIVKRSTNGLCSAKTSIGSDPTNFITKLFNIHLKRISEYVTTLYRSYIHELCTCTMNFIQGFNHCVNLLYYSSPTSKTESLLGYHCDVIYNDHGSYVHDQNSQVENGTSPL